MSRSISDLGIERGDIIFLEPTHETCPSHSVHNIDRGRIPELLPYLDAMTLHRVQYDEGEVGGRPRKRLRLGSVRLATEGSVTSKWDVARLYGAEGIERPELLTFSAGARLRGRATSLRP